MLIGKGNKIQSSTELGVDNGGVAINLLDGVDDSVSKGGEWGWGAPDNAAEASTLVADQVGEAWSLLSFSNLC